MIHVQYHVSWFVPQMESGKTPDADGVFSKAPIFNFNDDKLKFDTVTRIWTYDTPRVSRDAPLYTYPPNAFRVTRAILDQMRASGTSVTATDIAQVYLRVGAKVDNVASAAKRMCQHLLKSGYFYEHASGIYGLTKEGRNPTRGAAPGRTKKAKIQ